MLAGAALTTALLAAPAAQAQHFGPGDDPGALPVSMRFAPPREAVPGRSAGDDMFREKSGIGISARSYNEEDGSLRIRRGLIGNWKIADQVEGGVGLFSVTGDGRKQTESKRSWSVKEMAPRSSTIAAVGVRVKF